MKILGIYRELLHSPHRESDDALILRAVLAKLSGPQIRTSLAEPGSPEGLLRQGWDAVLPMCETSSRLTELREWQGESGALILNNPQAVLNTYRTRMAPQLKAAPGVPFPLTEIRRVGGPNTPPPSFFNGAGIWVKRGDVHNTCDHDVVRVWRWEDMQAVRRDFQARGISHYLLQQHIQGDLIKFYGVGPGRWFTWFYHNPEEALRLPFSQDALEETTIRVAAVLGLEIYGGDAIIGADGKTYVIDINSWPSFARVREEASTQIAAHVRGRAAAHPAACAKAAR